ncbi:MAG: transcription termination/antitermination protein NusA [Anaerolineaceae bacterium]|nr:transcription termination/antitermination protein NusA [Anaerolineaceae bacterium]
MNGDMLRLIDSIAREKNIDRDIVFEGIEGALLSATRKHYGQAVEIVTGIDRMTGQMSVSVNGVPIEPRSLGRIAAQAAKQVMIQKNREAERDSIFEEFSGRQGSIVSGQVSRIEGGNIIVTLSRSEGFLPRSEQIPGEAIHEADRIRALILDVRESGNQVKIVLSRTHADFIRRLFELEVPEVSDRIIEIRAIAREAGQRTKVGVSSIDTRVDAVGACVGIRGSRIKNIVDELGGEKIDIVRFNESSQVFIANALRPAEVEDIFLNHDINRATVIVPEDQLSLAIGKRGQNVRLAARLTGWDIDIMMAEEFDQQRANAAKILAEVPGMTEELAERISGAGFVSLSDIARLDPEVLTRFEDVSEELARDIVSFAFEYMRQIEAAEAEAKEAAEAAEETEVAEPGEPDQEPDAEAAAEEAENSQDAPDEAAGESVAATPTEDGEEDAVEPQVAEAQENEPAAEAAVEESPVVAAEEEVAEQPAEEAESGATEVSPEEDDKEAESGV